MDAINKKQNSDRGNDIDILLNAEKPSDECAVCWDEIPDAEYEKIEQLSMAKPVTDNLKYTTFRNNQGNIMSYIRVSAMTMWAAEGCACLSIRPDSSRANGVSIDTTLCITNEDETCIDNVAYAFFGEKANGINCVYTRKAKSGKTIFDFKISKLDYLQKYIFPHIDTAFDPDVNKLKHAQLMVFKNAVDFINLQNKEEGGINTRAQFLKVLQYRAQLQKVKPKYSDEELLKAFKQP